MGNAPLVTVVIPTYNHAHFLPEALQSVCDQSFTDWEAVVVNNYSEDETIAVVEGFGDPRIRLENFHNHGIIAAARNRGIALGRGRYVAFLDSDDKWYPEKLETCVSRLEDGYDLVCHGLRWFGDRRERDVFFGPESRASFDALLYRGNCIATSATVVRRDRLEAVGGFCEDAGIVTAEDYHLWLKLARQGAKMGFIDRVLGYYRFHGANTGSVLRQERAIRRIVEEFFPDKSARTMAERLRVRARYGIIDYEMGRALQRNGELSAAWPYLFRSWFLHPMFLQTYAALVLNACRINIAKAKHVRDDRCQKS